MCVCVCVCVCVWWEGGGGGVSFQYFSKAKGESDFSSHNNGRVGKRGEVVLKKGGRGITYLHTNPFQCYLSMSVWHVCVLLIHTIFISIICFTRRT